MDKKRALWQLLCENPSDLNCEECFAVMEFYAGVLATTGPGILAKVLEHLEACPTCRAEHGETLRRLIAAQSQDNGASQPGQSESDDSDQEE